MLHEFSSRTTRSRTVAAAVAGIALLALLPLRLVARPSAPPHEASITAAEQASAAAPVAVERPRAEGVQPAPRQEPRHRSEPSLRFVLIDEGQQTVSGSSQDLDRARRQQRDGEPLLWFEKDGREYVIRDRDVIREAREAWRSFNEHHLERFAGQEHLEAMGKVVADSKLAAEAGALGAQIGAMAGEIVGEALKDFHLDLSGLDALKELHHLKDLDLDFEHTRRAFEKDVEKSVREVEKSMREMHEHIQRDAHQSLKRELRDEIEHHRHQMDELKDRLRELEGPIREMTEPLKDLAEPLAELGHHIGDMGREIGELTREAMEQMREIIERELKSGRAHSVR